MILLFSGAAVPMPETTLRNSTLMMSYFVYAPKGKPCTRFRNLLKARKRAKRRESREQTAKGKT